MISPHFFSPSWVPPHHHHSELLSFNQYISDAAGLPAGSPFLATPRRRTGPRWRRYFPTVRCSSIAAGAVLDGLWCCSSRGHCLTAGSAPGSGCHGRRHAYGLRRRQRRRSQGNPQLRPLPAGQLTQQLARHCLWLAVHNFVNSGRLEGTLWGY